MKPLLFGIAGCFLLASGSFFLQAQTNAATATAPPNSQLAREYRLISFMTPADQERYAKAREKALADNPDIKSEGDALIKQGNAAINGGTAADKQAFIEKMNSHRQKLRQAMLKEDPTLEPVFAQIDKHISEMRAKQLGQVQNSTSQTNAPPSR